MSTERADWDTSYLANRRLARRSVLHGDACGGFQDARRPAIVQKGGNSKRPGWRCFCNGEDMQKVDDWTIERWRTEPRLVGLKFSEPAVDQAQTPLWKDLTVASALAVLFWAAAAIVFS
jgi:hypothetical protein